MHGKGSRRIVNNDQFAVSAGRKRAMGILPTQKSSADSNDWADVFGSM